jgi:hypothetical protein
LVYTIWNTIVLQDGTIIVVKSSAEVANPPPADQTEQLRIHADALASSYASHALNQALARPCMLFYNVDSLLF